MESLSYPRNTEDGKLMNSLLAMITNAVNCDQERCRGSPPEVRQQVGLAHQPLPHSKFLQPLKNLSDRALGISVS